jgi:ribonuclease P protein component
LRFRHYHHLKKRKDFLAARNGLLYRTSCFIFQARLRSPEEEGQGVRFGLTVTRKVGNAVERNRMRRRLRSVIHHNFRAWAELPPLDMVLLVRSNTLTSPFSVLESDLQRCLLFVKKATAHHMSCEPMLKKDDMSWNAHGRVSHISTPSLPVGVL